MAEGKSPRISCTEENCHQSFDRVSKLRIHQEEHHDIVHPQHEESFKTKKQLNKWKQDYQKENLVDFRRHQHIKKSNKTVYYCNRSSFFKRKSRATGKRAAKESIRTHGLSKNNVCTCGYTVTEKDGLFEVIVYPTHSNHTFDTEHLKCLRMTE